MTLHIKDNQNIIFRMVKRFYRYHENRKQGGRVNHIREKDAQSFLDAFFIEVLRLKII